MTNTLPTLYLHVGFPKCGTTSLQTFLYKEKNLLAEEGVIFPDFDNSFFQHVLFHAIRDRNEAQTKKIKDEITLHLERNNNVLISTENFTWSHQLIYPLQIYHMFATICDIKIIIYVRNYFEFINATYCEQIQGFENQSFNTFEEFLSVYHFNNIKYYDICKQYIDIFGRDNVIVRPFIAEYWKDNSLISDFLSLLEIENETIISKIGDQARLNISLSFQEIEYIRNLNKCMMFRSRPVRKKFIELMGVEFWREYGKKTKSWYITKEFFDIILSNVQKDCTSLQSLIGHDWVPLLSECNEILGKSALDNDVKEIEQFLAKRMFSYRGAKKVDPAVARVGAV